MKIWNKFKRLLSKLLPGLGIKDSEYDFSPNAKVDEKHKGKRRLVENPKTGKLEWSDGIEPLPLSAEDKDFEAYSNMYRERYESSVKDYQPHFRDVESYRINRFILEFPGIKTYLVRNFRKNSSSNTASFDIQIIFPFEDSDGSGYDICDVLNEYKEKIKKSKSKKIKTEDVKLKALDAVGEAIKTIDFNNVKIIDVEFFEKFDYEGDGLMYGTILFSYDKEVMS